MKNLFTLFLLLTVSVGFAQKGIVRGSIIEDATGETLIGVNVVVAGTQKGAITDLDGEFSIELAPGTYDLQISYITFKSITISEVTVEASEVTLLQNIRMTQDNLELGEVVITAEAVRNNEVALLSIKKKSASMMDGISAAKMRMTGDATAVEAAKRVTGVSIEGGRYVYIRGLGDRYSKTTLNGMDIPGLDPDKNSLQMDMFPSNLIDNIMVSKTFTADMPADFTGGILNIETKAFPEERSGNVSFGVTFNPSMHFNSNHLSSEGSSTDFLGFDDGTRALPAGANSTNIPTPISGNSPDEVNDFVRSFNPDMDVQRKTSLMNYSGSFAYGDQKILQGEKAKAKNAKLGYTVGLSYSKDYRYYDDMVYGEYQRFIDPTRNEMRYATIQNGELSEENVLVGLMGGVAYKTNKSKLRLSVMHLQSGEGRAAEFSVDNDGEAVGQSGYLATTNNIEYEQRSLSNVLVNGSHVINSQWELDWRISPTFSTSTDPDIRRAAFTTTAVDTSFIAGAGGNPVRIWRSLSELNLPARVDLTRSYKFNGADAKLKFGAGYVYKDRDYEILTYDMQFFGNQSWNGLEFENLLNPENIYPNSPNSVYFQSGNRVPNTNAYQSNAQTTSFYVSNEAELLPNLKTVLGVRMESFVQNHTGRDQSFANGDLENGRNLDNDRVLETVDFFPSVNLIYSLNENQNIRASASRTIARPSFKELSFAQILDPITNRIFNGALFPYSDWDGNLVETNITNLDLRWELFQKNGQLFSVSGFYKSFNNPIELVRIPEQQTSTEFQPRNVGQGELYGVEIELRKNFKWISPFLEDFGASANVTFVESVIDMTDREFNSRLTYEKEGQNLKDTRQMAGQSPYVINAGLDYNKEEHW
ncbi:MAG: TonB-dependent receptor [Flavobacteriales bacterium]|nr:TonB-dependent receptor [Flavobacteriales bacterium]